ncbi:unnamed protein product [Prorocentrum cordatum]|uniref:Secreted protein n=1 Tax=Prorocentrum cordatum TaxID=2364126 RepID=A0ABN9W6A0_9DINO|nr:unnamed protein product [Polarella glacialis]
MIRPPVVGTVLCGWRRVAAAAGTEHAARKAARRRGDPGVQHHRVLLGDVQQGQHEVELRLTGRTSGCSRQLRSSSAYTMSMFSPKSATIQHHCDSSSGARHRRRIRHIPGTRRGRTVNPQSKDGQPSQGCLCILASSAHP